MRANLIGGGVRGSLECKKMLKELDMKNKRVKKEEAAFKLLREVRANSIDGDKIILEYHKKVNEERKTGVGKRKGREGLMIDQQ